ncbi:5-oxoprolinase subunit PxpB, partial [Paenibacillus contaminans]
MESMERKVGDATLYPLGDQAVVIRFGEHLSEETHRKVRLFDALLNEQPFPGMIETVPSFAAVAVFYDLVQVTGAMEFRYGCPDREKSGKDGMGGQGEKNGQVRQCGQGGQDGRDWRDGQGGKEGQGWRDGQYGQDKQTGQVRRGEQVSINEGVYTERGQVETASFDRASSPFRIVCDVLEDLLGEVTEQETETPRIVEIPVRYGDEYGLDLEVAARYHGITEEALIRRHAEAEYTVYMLGFTPGFPYLGGMAEEIATPRRGTPRLSVPEGSVGIGGKQTGVYPLASPGGWQLIGRTPIRLFRPEQTPPSLLEVGDKVRFRPIGDAEYVRFAHTEQTVEGLAAGVGGAGQGLRPQTEVGQAPIRVLKPGLYTTVQDLGRTGSQRYGVPWSGAVDAFALRTVNVLVGNDEGAAALEVTLAGPELAFAEDTLIAICGGELSPAIDGRPVPAWRPVLVRRGAVLRFGACAAGCRAYVA